MRSWKESSFERGIERRELARAGRWQRRAGRAIALTALVAAPEGDAKAEEGASGQGDDPQHLPRRRPEPGPRGDRSEEFVDANGEILREVDQTNFPLRAKGLGSEIKQKKPDLSASRRSRCGATARPTSDAALTNTLRRPPTVRYDFLELLLQARAARAQGPTTRPSWSRRSSTSRPRPTTTTTTPPGSARRRHQRPADDARRDPRQQGLEGEREARRTRRAAPSSNLLTPNVAGIDVPVTRGWTAATSRSRRARASTR